MCSSTWGLLMAMLPSKKWRVHFTRVAELMVRGGVGTFWCGPLLPVATALILSTTAAPSTTLPTTPWPWPSGLGALSMALSFTLMKNCDVAELGLPVRAIAMVYVSFLRPLLASRGIGALVGLGIRSAV